MSKAPKPDRTPIHMETNGVLGIATQPFSGPDPETLALTAGRKRAMLIDLAGRDEMVEMVTALQESGVEVVAYRDHHFAPDSEDERDRILVENAERIKAAVGEGARFEVREKAPSCIHLVELGEAIRKQIDLILFHGDVDGFFSYLKAAGIEYDEMEWDAAILDDSAKGEPVSEHVRLFLDAIRSTPGFNRDNPGEANRAREQVNREFIEYIRSGFDGVFAKPLQEKAKKVEDEIRQTNRELLKYITILEGGVAYLDTTLANGKKFSKGYLDGKMFEMEGVQVAAQKKNVGVLAKKGHAQITITRSKKHQDLDLRDYIPDGYPVGDKNGFIISNTPFVLHLREDLFEAFVEKFNGKNKSITPKPKEE